MKEALRMALTADLNKSGRINARELQVALSNGTWRPFNPETIRMMIALFDRYNDFRIDFWEFYSLWNQLLMWQQSFAAIDLNRSGAINLAELRNALWASRYRVSDQFRHYLMMKMDRIKTCTSMTTLALVLPSKC